MIALREMGTVKLQRALEKESGAQPGGGFGPFSPTEIFKILHSNFDIFRNFQRIKMKFYILIMTILYSNSENFHKCSVCLRQARNEVR